MSIGQHSTGNQPVQKQQMIETGPKYLQAQARGQAVQIFVRADFRKTDRQTELINHC